MSIFQKSCYNCTLVKIYTGFPGSREEPPEDDVVRCQAEQWPGFPLHVYESFFEAYNPDRTIIPLEQILPQVCGHYTPLMIAECSECGKPINEEERLWQIYGSAFAMEPAPCCSQQCADINTKRCEERIREASKYSEEFII